MAEEMDEWDIDLAEFPEATEEQMRRAKLRIAGMPVAKGQVRVNMLLDADIVSYSETLASGRFYQMEEIHDR